MFRSQDDTEELHARCIYGLLFFGVPNRGIRIDQWLPIVKGQPNSELVGNLRPGSSYLTNLQRNFDRCFRDPSSKILSMFETMMTKTAKVQATVLPPPRSLTLSRHLTPLLTRSICRRLTASGNWTDPLRSSYPAIPRLILWRIPGAFFKERCKSTKTMPIWSNSVRLTTTNMNSSFNGSIRWVSGKMPSQLSRRDLGLKACSLPREVVIHTTTVVGTY